MILQHNRSSRGRSITRGRGMFAGGNPLAPVLGANRCVDDQHIIHPKAHVRAFYHDPSGIPFARWPGNPRRRSVERIKRTGGRPRIAPVAVAFVIENLIFDSRLAGRLCRRFLNAKHHSAVRSRRDFPFKAQFEVAEQTIRREISAFLRGRQQAVFDHPPRRTASTIGMPRRERSPVEQIEPAAACFLRANRTRRQQDRSKKQFISSARHDHLSTSSGGIEVGNVQAMGNAPTKPRTGQGAGSAWPPRFRPFFTGTPAKPVYRRFNYFVGSIPESPGNADDKPAQNNSGW